MDRAGDRRRLQPRGRRADAGRADQQHLAGAGRARAPTSSAFASTRSSSPRGSWRSTTSARRRPSACATATTSSPPTSGSSSAITSRPSPARGRWSVPCSPRSSAICRARSGSSSAPCSAARCRTSSSCSPRCGATARSLGQMAREEIGRLGGVTALLTVLLIMIILLAVVALVVVNALQGQPLGHVHDRGDDADRGVHGPVPALLAARQGAGGVGHRLRAGGRAASSRASGSPNRRRWRRSFTLTRNGARDR